MSKLVDDLYDLLSLAKEESEPNRYDNSDEYKELFYRLENALSLIDNANPSKAMEYVDVLYANAVDLATENTKYLPEYLKPMRDKIKQVLLKSQEQEKVLEIVFEKRVDICILTDCDNVNEYNKSLGNFRPVGDRLTYEEFDLLKRWINNEQRIESIK